MAGYPPQQHYAAVHQPPHVAPYHVPGYPIHPPPSSTHHPYPPHLSGGGPYQSNYAPPPTQSQASTGAGSNSASGSMSLSHSQQQQHHQQTHHHPHNMHASHNATLDRGPGYDTHRNQSVRPASQAASQVSQAGPSLPRSQHGGLSSSTQRSQIPHHNVVAPTSAHSHSSAPSHIHNHVVHPLSQEAHYGVSMHPLEYEQQSLPPSIANTGSRMNQAIPVTGQNGTGNSTKRANGSVRGKEKEGLAHPRSSGASKGAGGKRGNQEKHSGSTTGTKQMAGSAIDKNTASMMASAAAAASASKDEPLPGTKKIQKRQEVVERIHKVHWDTMDNREMLYQDQQHKLSMISTTLLLWPSNSRSYLMALHRLNLERDAQLRQSALLHAHQVESARTAYEQEKNKVEDEARNSKRIVRERLLSAVEDRRRRLRDDKESGEGMSDTLLDASTRPHATRKLRNKGTSSSKRGVDSETGLASRAVASNANGTTGLHGSLLGLLFSGTHGATGDGTSTPRGGDNNSYLGGLTSLAEFNQLSGLQGPIASLPPSNFDSAANNAVNLLHLQGVGGGMGDSSYMSGTRVALQNQSKGKKKPGGKGSLANAGVTTGGAANGPLNALAINASGGGGDDDDDANGSSRAVAAAAAAAAAASLAIGTGRLRWDQGKSVGQLTSAKDIEIESDLISIRKTGNKRRRR